MTAATGPALLPLELRGLNPLETPEEVPSAFANHWLAPAATLNSRKFAMRTEVLADFSPNSATYDFGALLPTWLTICVATTATSGIALHGFR